CDECGQAMIKRNKRYKETIKEFYICGTYNQGNGCSRHSISKNKLLEILEKILFSQLKYREKLIEKIEKIENFSIPLLSNSLDLEKSRRKYQVLNQGLMSDLEDEILTVEEF
ncbi:recombinase zinc ribbon domain-containing protein, partial [Streptococcus suis]